MHTVMWTVNVNEGTSRQDMLNGIQSSAPGYKGVAGLQRTYFGISPDGRSVAEICLWDTKAAADKFYTGEWEAALMMRWQSAPIAPFWSRPMSSCSRWPLRSC